MQSIDDLFAEAGPIDVVDVGASPIDGEPPYQRLMDRGWARVVGFEPHPEEFQTLQAKQSSQVKFLPYAIGDGQPGVLRICHAPGMTSLLEPDLEVLGHFHGFAEWGTVLRREEVQTHRLDDVREIEGVDYLKLDVQGGELGVIRGAAERLKSTLVVHTEVQFVGFYKNQPLFAEVDQALREAGFFIHRFGPTASRVFKPLRHKDDVYAGMSQILWAEAIYVRKFTEFERLSTRQLLKIAAIVHELYGSFDLASLALGHADRKEPAQRQVLYLTQLTGGH